MRKISLTESELEKFLESINEGILICNMCGNIEFVNHALVKLIGYGEKQILNMKIQDLIEDWNDIQDKIIQENIESSVKCTKNILKFNLSVYTLYGACVDNRYRMVVLRKVKRERKLAGRLLDSKAIYTFDKIIGKNKNFLDIIEYAKKISDSKSTILITGESGTGKEVFAQAIHNYSSRREKYFVAVNCGAVPVNLIESELFGYADGAFTGAKKGGNPGKFELADGGTIFLDEVGEMPLEMQVKLLRVIEEGVIVRIGSSRQIPINVRIIAATNKNLNEEVEHGDFRKDLFYRLNVLPIHLPPLRHRKEDIPLLVAYYMNKISKKLNKNKITVTESEMLRLIQHDWPGNIRELENIIELCINIGDMHGIRIPQNIYTKKEKTVDSNSMNLEIMEKNHIINMLENFNGNISLASKAMGIGRNTLYRKIKKYHITVHNWNV